MRDRISDLVEKQFEVDYKIVMNNIAGKDVAAKLSEKDKEKMLVYIADHESVTCLILGLAARLAKAEQNIVDNEDLRAEEKKREKLADQLMDAMRIKESVDKKYKKVIIVILRRVNKK